MENEVVKLPIEIIIDILLRTDGITLGSCRRVCKQWRNVIDNSDYLWKRICYKEFPYSSRIAKEISHSACNWNHIFKNLTNWSRSDFINTWNVESEELEFSLHEFIEILSIALAPLRASKFRRLRLANNKYALIISYNLTLVIVRPVDNAEYKSEKYIQAMGFSLFQEQLYFFYEKDIFMCNLLSPALDTKCIHHCDFNVKEIKHFDGETLLFTKCGRIVKLSQGKVVVKVPNWPREWKDQIHHICAINDKNYIFYSRCLFYIETDNYTHLYFEFQTVTALFFYGDNVLIADRNGCIWLYRPSEQRFGSKPIMKQIIVLPMGQYAVNLDVFEKKSGPIIVAVTLRSIFLVAIDFCAEEKDDEQPLAIKRLQMYKRVLQNRIYMKMNMKNFE